MATPRKRKNAADHGSMKINKFFKPIKNTVVHVPSENNDENLPPQGQPVEKKRAFGHQSFSKAKPVKSPLKDRNPEVRICTSNGNQSNRAAFSVLRDDDIKKGVVKAPQPEQKDFKVIQLSQSSSQTPTHSNQSSQSSQSNNSQKDDLLTKIKPKRLFTVFNDKNEEDEEDDKQSQSSHSQKQNMSLKQGHLADFIDDLFDQDSQSSQTSVSQQENHIPKQKPFSIFMDSQENEQKQPTQESHHQDEKEEDNVSKRKPFSVFIDPEDDDNNNNDNEQTHITGYPHEENVHRQPMFPVYRDNQEDDDDADDDDDEKRYYDRDSNHLQQENIDSKSNSRRQRFEVYKDENDSRENTQNEFSQTDEIQQQQQEEIIAVVPKIKPKKLFSVFVDDCENESTRDDVAGFGVFRDEEDEDHESTNMKQSELRVLRDKTKEVASENNNSSTYNGFFDDDADNDDDEEEEDLAQLLTLTRSQTNQGLQEEKTQESAELFDFFSDDQDSDTYSEIIPLHDNEFSTACEPLSTTCTDSNKMTDPYKVNASSHSDSSSSESDSKDTNDTTPPVRSNMPSETNQSIVSLEAPTLSPSFHDPVEEIYTAYPNPRGDSLNEKLGLTKNEA